MTPERFRQITARYAELRVAVVGDFCLDRYLEIDPARQEISIETGLPVHNVVRVRSQPGAAGTILNNLEALGIGTLLPVGFCGDDGEGYELLRALRGQRGVCLDFFTQTDERRTFTYCKPLLMHGDRPPEELSRLDSKNWSPTPADLQEKLIASLRAASAQADAIILMDQVDVAETGVVTSRLLEAVRALGSEGSRLLMLGDSRRGLRGWPPVCLKMNAAELAAFAGAGEALALEQVKQAASKLARASGHPVFVTLAERGIVGAAPGVEAIHAPSLPLRGLIDVVGAGDAVTANLTAALAAGASVGEALEMAMGAASLVIHQLGTTGTASIAQMAGLLPWAE